VTISFGYVLYCGCFNLYCGGFKLFCNVCGWVCVCLGYVMCMCGGGGCNVCVGVFLVICILALFGYPD
jgi:hypothetical protein